MGYIVNLLVTSNNLSWPPFISNYLNEQGLHYSQDIIRVGQTL